MGVRSRPFEGKVRLSDYSSLRKLARAMRRGLLDPEREQLIKQTMASANRETLSRIAERVHGTDAHPSAN